MSTQTRTYIPKAGEIKRQCFLVDAQGEVLGRLATRIARILLGKHKEYYTSYLDCGDQVVVVNAEGIRVTGRKEKEKVYQTYTGYPGGRRVKSYEEFKQLHPERVLSEAVRRMLPNNRTRDRMMKRLRIVCGSAHPHAAQKPIVLDIHL